MPRATTATIGPVSTNGIRKATALTSLKRRELARLTVPAVTTLESTTQVSTPRTAPTRAPNASRMLRDQVPTVASATSDVAAPGVPISPARARPASICGIGTAKVVNRAGSRVRSAAEATIGMIAQPSTAPAPPSTTTVCAVVTSAWRSSNSPTTPTPTMPRA